MKEKLRKVRTFLEFNNREHFLARAPAFHVYSEHRRPDSRKFHLACLAFCRVEPWTVNSTLTFPSSGGVWNQTVALNRRILRTEDDPAPT